MGRVGVWCVYKSEFYNLNISDFYGLKNNK